MKKIIGIIYKVIYGLYSSSRNAVFNLIFKFSLYCQGADFGANIKTYGSVPKISINRKACKVEIGSNVKFNNYDTMGWNSKCAIRVGQGGALFIDDYSGFNGACICCFDEIHIGKYVKIGGGTRISDSNHHSLDYLERREDNDPTKVSNKKIVIEDDVFIGAGCFIGKGVVIGARSIIAQGSVVVKDIPSDCIAAGNPCKVIKSLNS